jgi:hypothetical protein
MAESEVVLALAAGALSAEMGCWVEAFVRTWLDEGAHVIVPAPDIAEAIRGRPSDVAAHLPITSVRAVAITTETIARTAGARLATAKSSQTIDALTVVSAEA